MKKIIAGFLSLAMMTQSAVFTASAESGVSAEFAYDDFTVNYEVTNSYGNTDVVNISLTNTGDKTIENWMLYFNPNGDVQYVTNAAETTTANGYTYFKNSGYNADIAPNSTVTFTYAVNDCTAVPDDYAFCQSRAEKNEGYDVSLSVGDVWGDSFNGSIVITNHTNAPIEAWELAIDTNFTITEITNSWAATVTELEPYSYLLKGTYTGTVYANSSVTLGFIGVKDGDPEITNYSLTEVIVDEDALDSIINGSEEDEFQDDCIDWSTMPDSDEDGLPDELEEEYGCDPANPDTDGDRLPDGYEILTVGSNPADAHSLDSTLTDGEYDNDQDGLSNYEEYLLGTDPLLTDSDFDGLTDGDEVNVYGTDPLNPDTDGDGLSDGDEIALGLNPLVVDSNGDGIPDNEEKFSQSKSFDAEETDTVIQGIDVAFEGTGYIHSTTTVESVMDVDWMCSNVVGLIGEPYDISSESTISAGTITFHVDQTALDGSSFDDLAVLWYNEEEQRFVEMETVSDADNSTLTVTTEHFSKYLIVDCSRWYAAWSENNYPSNGNALHTAITIDCSDSMNWNDPEDENGNCYRKTAANGFVDSMHVEDKASVILFHEDSILKQSLTDDKDLLKTAISQMFENGYTNYDSALRTAIDSLDVDNNPNADNIIIFLSDGIPTDNTGTEVDEIDTSLVEEAKSKGIRIYTIGLTSNVREDILTYMAETTHGEYYYADTAQKLIEYFLTINMEEKYDITTDTDDDGLPDLFETYGMPVANGQVLFSDPENTDSDGDGLLDGEEVIMHIVDDEEEVKAAYNYMYNYIPDIFISDNGGIYFTMVADPEDEDTDGDGISDYDEVKIIGSDANKEDTDGDGIIDGNEIENLTTDSRYDKLSPLEVNTIESLYPELNEETTSNNEDSAITIRAEGNNIIITPKIHFDTVYAANPLEIEYLETVTETEVDNIEIQQIINRIKSSEYGCTLEALFLDGIVQRWSGTYEGSIYDFYPGLKVNVSVNPVVIELDNAYPHFIHVDTNPENIGAAGLISKDGNPLIILTVAFNTEGYNKSLLYYECSSAHEFGHVLGLADGYAYTGFKILSNDEVSYCGPHGSTTGGDIMIETSTVLPNDVEMVLYRAITGELQRFMPEYNEFGEILERSAAIRYDCSYTYFAKYKEYNLENEVFDTSINYRWDSIAGYIPEGSSVDTVTVSGVEYIYTTETLAGETSVIICGITDDSYSGQLLIPSEINGYKVKRISEAAFKGTKINAVNFSEADNIISIGSYAFYGCENIEAFVFPTNINVVEKYIFANCTNLTNVEVSTGAKLISDSAFANCYNLNKAVIPEGVRRISGGVFYECENLTNITFPDSVESIGNSAFYRCRNLGNITIPENVKTIEAYAFNCCWWLNTGSITFYRTDDIDGYDKDLLYNDGQVTVYVPLESESLYQELFKNSKKAAILPINE